MNIAIFSDLHGRVLLAFMLCARWQQETGERITAILQAGDLGAFPDVSRADRATIRHAERDRHELGFMRDFAEARPEVAERLSETACPMIFVRGNHEDHTWLDTLERDATGPVFPIDPYQRIWCLRTAMPYTISDGATSLTTLGIGRIGLPPGSTKGAAPKYAQDHELERLYALGDAQPDILLTHDVPPTYSNSRSLGLDEIRLALDQYKPIYHIFGHTDEPYRRYLDQNGVTTSIRMADLNWDHAASGRPLHTAAMGILRWESRERHRFDVVDADWLREYSAYHWR